MFTDCPSCERLFRIRATQLKAADGWVRCGYCAETFYALERLHDAPVRKPRADQQPEELVARPPAADIDEQQAPTLAQQIPEPDEAMTSQQDETITPPPDETITAQPDEAIPPPLDEAIPPLPDEAIPPPPETTDKVTAEAMEDSELLAELPPVLDYEYEKPTGSSSRYFWAGLLIILSMIALMQVAWFNRDWLLREYPQLTPWAEKFCERLQCDLIRFRDVSAIKWLHREVRMHPRYRNAVQVGATIVNQGEFIQPYPEIELLIFAADEQVISHGRFKPAEYLKPDINPAAGMTPGAPIHFVLELAGASQEAVSFEFRLH